ncbi:MAG: hypothetical protein IH994_04165 [Proteobacteria bacterium]|nr:hypothetical protein [Pseudomonadota bacterium]
MALQLFGGFVVLGVSAEVFIGGGIVWTGIFRVPPLVTGMTVVAIGTSATVEEP